MGRLLMPKALFAFLISYCAILFYSAALAQNKKVILETGTHHSAITAIKINSTNTLLASSGQDQTVKIWDAYSGLLLRTFYFPLNLNEVWNIRCIEISNKGRVFVGGDIQLQGEKGYSVFYFDVYTGASGRIENFPAPVNVMKIVEEESYLIVGMDKKEGIQIYNIETLACIAFDDRYSSPIQGFAVNKKGLLSVVSDDNQIRLYRLGVTEFSLSPSNKLPANISTLASTMIRGLNANYISFYKNDNQIVLGYKESNVIEVYSIVGDIFTFESEFSIPATKTEHVANLILSDYDKETFVVSSKDIGANTFYLSTWKGVYTKRIQLGKDIKRGVANMLLMRNNDIVYVADSHSIESLNENNSYNFILKSPNVKFETMNVASILISNEGDEICFPYKNKIYGIFSAKESRVSIVGDEVLTNKKYKEPILDNKRIKDWNNSVNPYCDNQKITLDLFEVSRSACMTTDDSYVIIGTNKKIRFYNGNSKKMIGEVYIESAAVSLNISGNQKILIAGLENGTIQFYNLFKMELLLTFYPHDDKARWIAWTQSGYYASSIGFHSVLGWIYNQNIRETSKYTPIYKFSSIYNNPGVIKGIIPMLDEEKSYLRTSSNSANQYSKLNIYQIDMPTIFITDIKNDRPFKNNAFTFHCKIYKSFLDSTNAVSIYVDGRLQQVFRNLEQQKNGSLYKFSITLPSRNCLLSVTASSVIGEGIPSSYEMIWEGTSKNSKPTVNVLNITSKSLKNYPNFKSICKDALALVSSMKTVKNKGYNIGTITDIANTNISETSIRKGIADLNAKTTTSDIAIVSLSGVIAAKSENSEAFACYDADMDNYYRTTIQIYEILDELKKINGRVILFLDFKNGSLLNSSNPNLLNFEKITNLFMTPEQGLVVLSNTNFNSLNSPWTIPEDIANILTKQGGAEQFTLQQLITNVDKKQTDWCAYFPPTSIDYSIIEK